jgi:hypothetical protein
MIRIALVDDEESDLVPHAGGAPEHRLLRLSQRFPGKKRKPERRHTDFLPRSIIALLRASFGCSLSGRLSASVPSNFRVRRID